MTVLVFARGRYLGDWKELYSCYQSSDDVNVVFGCYGPEDSCSIDSRFYELLGQSENVVPPVDVDAVCKGCRLLRGLDKAASEKLVSAAYWSLDELIARVKPDMIVGGLVDEYISHLCSLIAKTEGILYLGFCGSLFNGKCAAYTYWSGVAFPFRSSSETEAEGYYDTLSNREFRQDYQLAPGYSFGRHVKLVFRHWVKRIIFNIRMLATNDRFNLHYKIQPFLADRKSLFDYVGDNGMSSPDEVMADKRKKVFLPMPYQPEATSDYWVKSVEKIRGFDRFVEELCNQLGDEYLVVVKEHPHIRGCVPKSFYRKLMSIGGAKVLAGSVESSFAENCDCILVGAGSVGVQGFMWDQPVISYCDHSYWFEATNASYMDLDKPAEWKAVISNSISCYEEFSKQDKIEALRLCLEHCFDSSSPIPWKGDPDEFKVSFDKMIEQSKSFKWD